MGHKTNLITFKSIEIISVIFSVHSGMKLVTTRKVMENKTDYIETKKPVTTKPMGQQVNQRKIKKKSLRQMIMKTTIQNY